MKRQKLINVLGFVALLSTGIVLDGCAPLKRNTVQQNAHHTEAWNNHMNELYWRSFKVDVYNHLNK